MFAIELRGHLPANFERHPTIPHSDLYNFSPFTGSLDASQRMNQVAVFRVLGFRVRAPRLRCRACGLIGFEVSYKYERLAAYGRVSKLCLRTVWVP